MKSGIVAGPYTMNMHLESSNLDFSPWYRLSIRSLHEMKKGSSGWEELIKKTLGLTGSIS
jgi:hypothetical protein